MLNIANIIKNDTSDAFVITHGTDTMCYTAAGLSFLLGNIGKPIIFTGSMYPLCDNNSDGYDNLQFAVDSAQSIKNSGVYIAMQGRLIHGAKAVKMHTHSEKAFASADGKDTAAGQADVSAGHGRPHRGQGQRHSGHPDAAAGDVLHTGEPEGRQGSPGERGVPGH